MRRIHTIASQRISREPVLYIWWVWNVVRRWCTINDLVSDLRCYVPSYPPTHFLKETLFQFLSFSTFFADSIPAEENYPKRLKAFFLLIWKLYIPTVPHTLITIIYLVSSLFRTKWVEISVCYALLSDYNFSIGRTREVLHFSSCFFF